MMEAISTVVCMHKLYLVVYKPSVGPMALFLRNIFLVYDLLAKRFTPFYIPFAL